MHAEYCKTAKNSDTRKIAIIIPKIETFSFYYRVIGPNDAYGMANSVNPDQTTPQGTV